MNKRNKEIKKAKNKMESFSARGSKCPICNKQFRYGCKHSVVEAKAKLFQAYIIAVAGQSQ